MKRTTDSVNIRYWSGNRTQIRQDYEGLVLIAVLEATEKDFGLWNLEENTSDLPGDEESKVFTEKNYDLLVSIAGNQKFKDQEIHMIEYPLVKNLLGFRIPIVRENVSSQFHSEAKTSDLKALVHGIPETWGDVTIFEENGYSVLEKGSLDSLFERLSNKEFDYTAFGANEILSVFEHRASKFENLEIAEAVLFYYPFPMVFYVHPRREKLAKRIQTGMERIQKNGDLDSIFRSFYGTLVTDLKLTERKIFKLKNPFIPETFKNLQPDLNSIQN
ncbi:hypothetical protein G3567_04150 [Psychroflexus sp. YR1-1]|uniref:Solute-binding protein family 3/N-terminal domain-containing protein n=1 Tax=Psychroflexus aurantiacus TaxID=2709310 RepID=A0A6B3QZR7_9FLAO|nr:hypothetical protein [Psychroflexus aurantiacus]NEV93342.1 hypothetical protein [Psychroflexus aurantiacus]